MASGPQDPRLFLSANGLGGGVRRPTVSTANLDEHEGATVIHHQVYFAKPAEVVTFDEPQSPGDKIAFDLTFDEIADAAIQLPVVVAFRTCPLTTRAQSSRLAIRPDSVR